MQRVQKTIIWSILASEISHVFCCILPTIFSVVSLLTGLGILSTMPGWLDSLHSVMHEWEVLMIISSGAVITLGWGLHFYSRKIDCHDTGCGHGPCKSQKNLTRVVLYIASGLFVVNVGVYMALHAPIALFHQH